VIDSLSTAYYGPGCSNSVSLLANDLIQHQSTLAEAPFWVATRRILSGWPPTQILSAFRSIVLHISPPYYPTRSSIHSTNTTTRFLQGGEEGHHNLIGKSQIRWWARMLCAIVWEYGITNLLAKLCRAVWYIKPGQSLMQLPVHRTSSQVIRSNSFIQTNIKTHSLFTNSTNMRFSTIITALFATVAIAAPTPDDPISEALGNIVLAPIFQHLKPTFSNSH